MKLIFCFTIMISMLFSASISAAFYDNLENTNNKECVSYTTQTADAMRMKDILKDAVSYTKAKPSPVILRTYYDVYDDMEKGSKGILDYCKLSKSERNKFMGIGLHAVQVKASISFILNDN